jgi:serine/threonine protein kinase
MTDDFEGKIIADKYRIETILRDSDLGVIYRGWHVLMDKPVTAKILAPALAVDKRFVERFLAEAKTLSQAAHPNILNVTDFGTDQRGVSYTVYEAADRETLKNLIEQDGAISVSQALTIAKQTASAIASAHGKGLFHKGLTAEKILISQSETGETAKVFDFGSQPAGWNSNSEVEYLAPEQYADPAKGDARSDIYSLGVIAYEMLAGVVPYAGQSVNELKTKQESGSPASLSEFHTDVPPDLEPMILSALAIDPERRYQSMRAFAEDLELVSAGIDTPNKAAAPARKIWQTAAIVFAGIILLAAALIYATSVKRTDPTAQLQPDAGSLPVQPIGPATGAQEESLAKLPAMSEAEIMAAQNSNTTLPPDSLPGGDGYNAWANGGAPPAGAPAQVMPPGAGQYYTIDPNTGSQFMPQLDLVCKDITTGKEIPCPSFTPQKQLVKPVPSPNAPAANTAAGQQSPGSTPKPQSTPAKQEKPAASPNKEKSVDKTAKPKE